MAAEAEDESEWIFEGIIQFLQSPRWKVPVLGFIDENCIIFEAGEGDEGEYKKQHDEFKKIIDGLFDTLMKDLGITEEQFINSCQKARQKRSHKKIVDQIMAVDNYDSFKTLMMKRNKELNEEALTMISGGGARAGHSHPRGVAAGGEGRAHNRGEEAVEKARYESEIEEAMRVSQALEEQRKIAEDEDERMLQEVLKLSKMESEDADKVKETEVSRKAREAEEAMKIAAQFGGNVNVAKDKVKEKGNIVKDQVKDQGNGPGGPKPPAEAQLINLEEDKDEDEIPDDPEADVIAIGAVKAPPKPEKLAPKPQPKVKSKQPEPPKAPEQPDTVPKAQEPNPEAILIPLDAEPVKKEEEKKPKPRGKKDVVGGAGVAKPKEDPKKTDKKKVTAVSQKEEDELLYDLPPVGKRAPGGKLERDLMKEQAKEMGIGNKPKPKPRVVDDEEEKAILAQPVESAKERRERLKVQRQLLLQKKKEERAKELKEFEQAHPGEPKVEATSPPKGKPGEELKADNAKMQQRRKMMQNIRKALDQDETEENKDKKAIDEKAKKVEFEKKKTLKDEEESKKASDKVKEEQRKKDLAKLHKNIESTEIDI